MGLLLRKGLNRGSAEDWENSTETDRKKKNTQQIVTFPAVRWLFQYEKCTRGDIVLVSWTFCTPLEFHTWFLAAGLIVSVGVSVPQLLPLL